MSSQRNLKTNVLQILIIIMALVDLIYGLFFLVNPEGLSAKFNLIINQPEDHLWRQILGVFFLVSSANFFPMLFAPMHYRHLIWLINVTRPIFIAMILSFSSVSVPSNESTTTWISQQVFFLVLFWVYLGLGLFHLILLFLTKKEALAAKKSGIQ